MLKKSLNSIKKENKNIISKESLNTIYGGNSNDKKKFILIYHPNGSPSKE